MLGPSPKLRTPVGLVPAVPLGWRRRPQQACCYRIQLFPSCSCAFVRETGLRPLPEIVLVQLLSSAIMISVAPQCFTVSTDREALAAVAFLGSRPYAASVLQQGSAGRGRPGVVSRGCLLVLRCRARAVPLPPGAA